MRQTRLLNSLLAALLLTGALNAAAAPWPHIGLDEARRLHSQPGTLFVDGRSLGEWKKGRIPGALSLPTGEFDKRYPQLKSALRKAGLIVIYCQGERCASADTLASLLAAKGLRKLAVFSGGFPAWKKSGFPVGP